MDGGSDCISTATTVKWTSMQITDKHIQRLLRAVLCLTAVSLLAVGCHYDKAAIPETAEEYSQKQLDSMRFADEHYYSVNYNFIVKADSINLIRQQPEEVMGRMMTDTVTVYRHDHIAVAEIRIIPTDSIDSVWVQVARDQETFGWQHETSLLLSVVPDDPISQFISTFSDTHLLIFLIVISLISVAYLMRTIFKRNAKIVHFNDINSFYPTLLAIIVSSSATLYASIRTFSPDAWQHFYYHPTLNPFNTQPVIGMFLVSVWAIFIVGLAVIDVVRNILPTGEALLYLCGLAGVCAVNYIIFSISTLYFIGYPMFAAYLYFALRMYFTRFRCAYICGNCGARMSQKGRCPECGAMNE